MSPTKGNHPSSERDSGDRCGRSKKGVYRVEGEKQVLSRQKRRSSGPNADREWVNDASKCKSKEIQNEKGGYEAKEDH